MPTLNVFNPTTLRPVAQVGLMKLWLRADVEEYVREHPAEITRRRRQHAEPGVAEGKKRSQFVTLSGFAHEVGMSLAQAQLVFAEPGFPARAASFGDAGVWLRADVEKHLRGNPGPRQPANALQELLMTGSELGDYLAYPASTRRSGAMDAPAPVVNTEAGNIYLREEVEAHLDAEPRRRELLEARRARGQGLSTPRA